MGLVVEVYRNNLSDCTNGGISRAAQLTLVNVKGPFEARASAPAAMLVYGLGRNSTQTVRIIPAAFEAFKNRWKEDPRWWMMGGNYAASSDSRFVDAVESLLGHYFYGAVAIHDRCEKSKEST